MKTHPKTVVRAGSHAEFLQLVPQLVGINPIRCSLVFVPFTGRRAAHALRIDLPRPQGDLALKRTATTLIGTLCKLPNVERVSIVVYTDRPIGDDLPHRELVTRIARRARQAGIGIVDLLVVAADGWGSYLDAERETTARPLEEIDPRRAPEVRAPIDIEAAARIAPASSPDIAAFAALTAQWRSDRDGELARLIAGGGIGERLERALQATPAVDEATALLAVVAERPSLRDAALLRFGWGAAFSDESVATAEVAGLAILGALPVRPDSERLARAIEVLRFVAAHLPHGDAAPVLAMLGWAYWSLGLGSVAGRFVDLAQHHDARYDLAGQLATLIDQGALPAWAYDDGSGAGWPDLHAAG